MQILKKQKTAYFYIKKLLTLLSRMKISTLISPDYQMFITKLVSKYPSILARTETNHSSFDSQICMSKYPSILARTETK